MSAVVVIVALTIVWTLPASGQWANDFDQVARFECTEKTTFDFIRSINDDYFEDRIWQFKCRPSFTVTSCFWTELLNLWDQTLDYSCPGNNFINGVYSVHDNYYEDLKGVQSHLDNSREDRRWKFYLCWIQ